MSEKTTQELIEILNTLLASSSSDNLIPERLVSAVISKLKDLQAELDKHRWIPVSERLPKKTNTCTSDIYLLTDGRNKGIGWYDYHFKEWKVFTTPLVKMGKIIHRKSITLPSTENTGE